jgi:hypothetical protein
METIDEEFLKATTDFIDRANRDRKPFFVWFNPSRMHIWTHLTKQAEGKTGIGVYPDGMVEHDRQVGQHLTGPVLSPAWLPSACPAIQLGRQPKPVGQLDQQRHPDVPDQSVAVGGDFESCPRLGSLHPQGALLDRGSRPSDSRILPAQRGHLFITAKAAPSTHENPGLVLR